MNPWIAKAVILVASVVMVVIRAPHGRRSLRNQGRAEPQRSARGRPADSRMEGFLVPLIWIVSPFVLVRRARFVPGRSAPESCASEGGSGGSTVHTPTWARTLVGDP